jgi:phosphoadenosine phosphosulfate reductase
LQFSTDLLLQVEAHYGFKATTFACADCATQEDFFKKYGEDFWLTDIDEYDRKCKVEPLQRALKETNTGAPCAGKRSTFVCS